MSIHFVGCRKLLTSKNTFQLSVTVLNRGTQRCAEVLIFHAFCGKRKCFPVDFSLQANETTRFLLQNHSSGITTTFARTLASFDHFKSHSGVKEMVGEMLRCTVVQRIIFQIRGLRTLLGGNNCTSTRAARQVSFKA